MTGQNANDDYTYRSQVNAAIDQLRLALETKDTGGADPPAERRVAEHGQRDRTARPVRIGWFAPSGTAVGSWMSTASKRRVPDVRGTGDSDSPKLDGNGA